MGVDIVNLREAQSRRAPRETKPHVEVVPTSKLEGTSRRKPTPISSLATDDCNSIEDSDRFDHLRVYTFSPSLSVVEQPSSVF